jgi:hypothetical protein
MWCLKWLRHDWGIIPQSGQFRSTFLRAIIISINLNFEKYQHTSVARHFTVDFQQFNSSFRRLFCVNKSDISVSDCSTRQRAPRACWFNLKYLSKRPLAGSKYIIHFNDAWSCHKSRVLIISHDHRCWLKSSSTVYTPEIVQCLNSCFYRHIFQQFTFYQRYFFIVLRFYLMRL